jgi:tetratricopeptide (TPR) repeat protein
MSYSAANVAQDLIERGEAAAALALLARAPGTSDVCAARASAHLALGDSEAALSAAREARQLEPANAAAHFNEGRALMLQGEPEAAAVAFLAAERRFSGVAEISARLGEAAFLSGSDDAAESALRRALGRAPAHALAFQTLADLLHQRADEAALDELLQRASAAGGATAYRAASAYARLQRRKEALAALARAEAGAPPAAAIDMLAADILREEGDLGRARIRAEAAARRAPRDPGANAPKMRLLLTIGAVGEAEALARQMLGANPGDQLWLAFLWTALAAQGSLEAARLLDFDVDVATAVLRPPAGYASIEDFNTALAAELRPLHQSSGAAPLGQSVHGGSQTRRPLQSLRSPALSAFFDLAREAAERFVAATPHDPSHPLRRWRGRPAKITGAWSVALARGGRHSAHVHPAGSVSSAYYVAAPAGGGDTGRLALGAPPFAVAGLEKPRRTIEPEPGRLALFPSYCWHGTTPFDGPGQRLTIAFDAVFR